MSSDSQLIFVFLVSLAFFVTPGILALISLFRHAGEFELKNEPLIRVRHHGSRPLRPKHA